MQCFQNSLAYFVTAVNYGCKIFLKSVTCGQFHEHLMWATYGTSKINCTVWCVHAPVHSSQNALAYIVTAVNYGCKIILKMSPDCPVPGSEDSETDEAGSCRVSLSQPRFKNINNDSANLGLIHRHKREYIACLSMCLSISTCLSLCSSVCILVSLFCPSVNLFVSQSVLLSVYLFFCQSFCLSVHHFFLSVRLSFFLTVCLSLLQNKSVCLPIC